MVKKTFKNGIPFPEEVREMIGMVINSEAFVQFPEDFGHSPLSTIMFAFENPKESLQPVLDEFRKNGFSILSIQETPLSRFPLYPFTKWYDITFMANSSEN
jgi:hypothetical protein